MKFGESQMATKHESAVADSGAKAPYPFRTTWALILLAINFLVAAYYFHIIE
jgi:photosystem I protein